MTHPRPHTTWRTALCFSGLGRTDSLKSGPIHTTSRWVLLSYFGMCHGIGTGSCVCSLSQKRHENLKFPKCSFADQTETGPDSCSLSIPCDIRASTVTGILAASAGHQWRAAKQSSWAFLANSDSQQIPYRGSSPCLQNSELFGTFMSHFISSLKLDVI